MRSPRRRVPDRPRCGTRRTGWRRRSPGSSSRCPATCSSSSRSWRRGARGTAGPGAGGARRVAAGARSGRRAGVPEPRGRRATSSSRCSCGRSRGSRPPRAWTRFPTASSLWAGLFDLRDTLLARPWTTFAPSRREATRITVVGSINLDLVARCERLPRAGETVSGATFSRVPGGKGANQAVACARLGAEVTLIGAVGGDPFAEEALVGSARCGRELWTCASPKSRRESRSSSSTPTVRTRSSWLPVRTRRSARSSFRRTTRCSASSRSPTRPSSRRGRDAPASSASTPRPRARSRSIRTSRS